MGLAQVVLVEHSLFAIARRAGVKGGLGIVVVGQVMRRVGAAGTELDPHLPAPKAGRLDSVRWPGVGGICVLQTAISDETEAKAIERTAQSYGDRWSISKGFGELYEGL